MWRMVPFRTLLAAGTLLLAPSAASAATICVGSSQPAGVSCDSTEPFTGTGLVNAVNTAATSSLDDVVRVAAGELTVSVGLSLDNLGNDQLIGAGRTQTSITSTITSGTAVSIGTVPRVGRLADLTVTTTALNGGTMVQLRSGSTIERVTLNERSANTASNVGIYTGSDASIAELDLSMNSSEENGILAYDGPISVRDSQLSGAGLAYGGFVASQDVVDVASQLTRVTIAGFVYGIDADSGSIVANDSVVDLQEVDGAVGVRVFNPNTSNRVNRFDGRQVTIVGGGSNQTGLTSGADNPDEDATFRLADSLIALSASSSTDVSCVQDNGGTTSFILARVAYRTSNTNTGNCSPDESGTVSLSPGLVKFRDAAAGDYRPTYDSIVVDAGATSNPTFLTDRGGATRKIDGNGDGTAQLDLGAYEYQRSAPTRPTATATTAEVLLGESVTFTAGASTDAEGEAISYAWGFGDGTTGSGATTSHTFGAAGLYDIAVRAIDSAGAESPVATVTIRVVVPSAAVTKAPSAKIKRSAKGFSLASAPSAKAATLSLNRATSLQITVAKLTPGRTKGGTCSAKAKSGKRCTISTAVKGTATVSVSGTAANLAFGGTFAGKRLKAGTYRVTLTPRAANGATGPQTSYTLTLK